MEIVLLEELPRRPGTGKLDVGAARRVVHEALAASNADVKLVYTLDSSVGANFLGSPEVAQAVERSQAQLALVVAGAPATHIGTVASTALGRTLKLNAQNKKNLVALQTAVAAFPQAGGRLRTMPRDGPLVSALSVVAHVLGFKAIPGPAQAGAGAGVAGAVQDPRAADAAAVAAAEAHLRQIMAAAHGTVRTPVRVHVKRRAPSPASGARERAVRRKPA